jgi:hypothetical protein
MKLPESLGRRLFLIGFKQAQYITHAAWAAAEPQRQIHFLPLLNQPLLRVDLLRPLPLELWRLLNPLLWRSLRLRPLQLRLLSPLLWWPLRAVQLPLEAGLVKHKALGLLPLLLPLRLFVLRPLLVQLLLKVRLVMLLHKKLHVWLAPLLLLQHPHSQAHWLMRSVLNTRRVQGRIVRCRPS